MALKATVYKAELGVADIDRGYYADHPLTLARHPSETESRLMLRVLAFALHADDALEFGRGISTDDEPDLWLKDPTGRIEHWIDLGLPDERQLRRAAGRAARVTLIAYGERAFEVWWKKHAADLERIERLSVWLVDDASLAGLGALADRQMRLQCLIQEGQITVSNDATSVSLTLQPFQTAGD